MYDSYGHYNYCTEILWASKMQNRPGVVAPFQIDAGSAEFGGQSNVFLRNTSGAVGGVGYRKSDEAQEKKDLGNHSDGQDNKGNMQAQTSQQATSLVSPQSGTGAADSSRLRMGGSSRSSHGRYMTRPGMGDSSIQKKTKRKRPTDRAQLALSSSS